MQYHPYQWEQRSQPSTYYMGRMLRRQSSAIGFTLLGIFLMMNVLAVILVLVLGRMGLIDYTQLNNGFQGIDPVAYYLMYGVYAGLGAILPVICLLRALNISLGEILPSRRVGVKQGALCVLFGMSVCMLANMMVNLLCANLEQFGVNTDTGAQGYDNSPAAIALLFFSTAVMPAFMEEFVYRGVVLGMLRRFGNGVAVVGSSLLFGLMHGNIVQIPFAFIVGLVLAYLVTKTGSIWVGVALHFANNAYACLMEVLSYQLSDGAYMLCYYLVVLAIILLGIVAAVILMRRQLGFFVLPSASAGPGGLGFAAAMRQMVLNPGVIAFAGVLLAQTVYLCVS